MELILDTKDLSAILLKWADHNICPGAFNTAEAENKYGTLAGVRLTYVEPLKEEVAT